MSIIKEFKTFAAKGNMIELAVAVIIGAAFGKIITSFVNDILMPPIGLALGDMDFKDLKYLLKPATAEAEAVTINYGAFIQNITDFLIIAMCVFLIIKLINEFKRKKEVLEDELPNNEKLLTEIRDILKVNKDQP